MNLQPGTTLNFNFTGSASNYPGTNPYSADGNAAWVINNYSARNMASRI